MYVAQYNDTGYQWKDQLGAYPYRYICDGNTELCSKPLPVDHVKISPTFPRQCLLAYVGGSTRSWHNSQSECTNLGTTLATVVDEDIFVAIQRELNKMEYRYRAYWIGLHKEKWIWVDGNSIYLSIYLSIY
ncbi:hypothetical protein LSH36_644g01072, partial [Paralvinella palmiformis]